MGAVRDLGAPISYLVLRPGVPVYDRNGDHVGVVAETLADESVDVFHGLIVAAPAGDRFAASDQVAGLYERGVRLSVDRDALHDPDQEPVAREAADDADVRLRTGLLRAREWLREHR